MDDGDRASEIRAELRKFKGKVKKVIGVDVDTVAAQNPSIDEFQLLSVGERWQIEDSSVDLCISDYVLEHDDDPDFFFVELNRVLRPGGRGCVRCRSLDLI